MKRYSKQWWTEVLFFVAMFAKSLALALLLVFIFLMAMAYADGAL